MYYIYIFVLFITYIWTALLCVKLKQTLTIIIKVLSPVIPVNKMILYCVLLSDIVSYDIGQY